LTIEEHLEVIRVSIEAAAGRIQVVAGTGSNDTRHALHTTRRAHELGADGMLLVVPYYNKPSQEGLVQHFSALADATDKPIMLYSIPGRSGIEIGLDTIVSLRKKYPHVHTIKEAGGSCDKVSSILQTLGPDMTVLSGDDSLTLPFMSVGAKGVVSVTSNLYPGLMVEMVDRALQNDFAAARALHQRLLPAFHSMLSLEPNPVCIKYAMYRAGLIVSPAVRLPLVEPRAQSAAALDQVLTEIG
ncbi:MAG: 4-hydroxy-tetrahydrodipicolinate synthase, partial [Bacteroidetes bacterium]